MKIKVDIISDVVCPWCYVGKKRFEKAVEKLPDFEFEVNYQPFQLHPEVGPEGTDLTEYLETKYGESGQVEEMQNRVIAVAHEEGIKMDFSKDQVLPSTLNAHAILESIEDSEAKSKLNEAFLSGYFEKGKNVGDVGVLIGLAKEAGFEIDPSVVNDTTIQNVLDRENLQKKSGVKAVPSFVINDKWLVQGAQPTDQLIQIFNQIEDQEKQKGENSSCTPGSGCC